MAVLEFRVLGPVEVLARGRRLGSGTPQQRLLLAALAVDAGRSVSVPTLVDRLWDEAPAGALRTLYVLITRLRRRLERASRPGQDAVRVVRRHGGYTLAVDP